MKKALIIIGVVVAIAAALVGKTLHDAGQFKTITPHCNCSCAKIEGLPGPEDITVDMKTGMAFISSDDRRATSAGRPLQGAVFGLDLNVEGAKPVNLTADFEKTFHPHGISLYKTEAGETLLFVINHTGDDHFVEIFEFRDQRLVHRESISHPLMFSPNDLVAVGPRSFYASNDHGSRSEWGRTLEDYLQLSRSYVVYFDGNDMKVAAKGFAYANGINVSPDGKKLYLATTIGRSLHVFARDIPTGKLTREFDISLNTGADNIEIDADGNLYIACHPKLLDFAGHAKDHQKPSPSQVLKIALTGTDPYHIEEIYIDDGNEISASSVAAPFDGGFLVGQVFEDHILRCMRRVKNAQ
jgi:arylesterase / paraoxonase